MSQQNYVIDEMISAKSIAARIEDLSKEIHDEFEDTKKLVVVGLLRGSFVFIADLVRELDLPVEVGLARAGKRSAPDRFERQTTAFFQRVRDGYLSLASAAPARYRVIDAAQSLADVGRQVEAAIDAFLERGDR